MSGVIGPVKRATADRLVKAGMVLPAMAAASIGQHGRTGARSGALADPPGRDAGQEGDVIGRKPAEDQPAWAPAEKEAQ